VNHFASPDFWFHCRQLPPEIRDLADKNFELLKQNLRHPSLRLKRSVFSTAHELVCITACWQKKEVRDWCGFGSVTTRNMTGCLAGEAVRGAAVKSGKVKSGKVKIKSSGGQRSVA
jgi:hypothetical protein